MIKNSKILTCLELGFSIMNYLYRLCPWFKATDASSSGACYAQAGDSAEESSDGSWETIDNLVSQATRQTIAPVLQNPQRKSRKQRRRPRNRHIVQHADLVKLIKKLKAGKRKALDDDHKVEGAPSTNESGECLLMVEHTQGERCGEEAGHVRDAQDVAGPVLELDLENDLETLDTPVISTDEVTAPEAGNETPAVAAIVDDSTSTTSVAVRKDSSAASETTDYSLAQTGLCQEPDFHEMMKRNCPFLCMDDAESDSDSEEMMDNINLADLIGSSIKCDVERKLERKDMSKQDTNILSDMAQASSSVGSPRISSGVNLVDKDINDDHVINLLAPLDCSQTSEPVLGQSYSRSDTQNGELKLDIPMDVGDPKTDETNEEDGCVMVDETLDVAEILAGYPSAWWRTSLLKVQPELLVNDVGLPPMEGEDNMGMEAEERSVGIEEMMATMSASLSLMMLKDVSLGVVTRTPVVGEASEATADIPGLSCDEANEREWEVVMDGGVGDDAAGDKTMEVAEILGGYPRAWWGTSLFDVQPEAMDREDLYSDVKDEVKVGGDGDECDVSKDVGEILAGYPTAWWQTSLFDVSSPLEPCLLPVFEEETGGGEVSNVVESDAESHDSVSGTQSDGQGDSNGGAGGDEESGIKEEERIETGDASLDVKYILRGYPVGWWCHSLKDVSSDVLDACSDVEFAGETNGKVLDDDEANVDPGCSGTKDTEGVSPLPEKAVGSSTTFVPIEMGSRFEEEDINDTGDMSLDVGDILRGYPEGWWCHSLMDVSSDVLDSFSVVEFADEIDKMSDDGEQKGCSDQKDAQSDSLQAIPGETATSSALFVPIEAETPSTLDTSPANVTFKEKDSKKPRAASSDDDVKPIFIRSAKELAERFDSMKVFFTGKETEDNWNRRQESVNIIRGMILTDVHVSFKKEFYGELKGGMLELTLLALRSLRTTLSSKAAALYSELALAMTVSFDQALVGIVLPPLLNMGGSTKNIVATKTQGTVLDILEHGSYQSGYVVNLLTTCYTGEKSVKKRIYALSHMETVLRAQCSEGKGTAGMGQCGKSMEACISKGLSDSSKEAKDVSCRCFLLFEKLFPKAGVGMRMKMDGKVKKLLERKC
ncbi:suppressor of tub2 mutation [Tulasnella sp. 419]|nr:suppressor of tub2 mutation [Tulasnella sp. 419]